jgi:hypothetical protein
MLKEVFFYSGESIKLEGNQLDQLFLSLSWFSKIPHTARVGTVHDPCGYCSAAQLFIF